MVSRIVYRFFTYTFFLTALSFSACTSEMREQLKPVPIAFGEINELAIIADRDMWESPIGDTIQFYYSSPFLILPQPEPILDLRFFSPGDLEADQLRKQLRTYLFVGDLSDPNSAATKMMTTLVTEQAIQQIRQNPKNNVIIGKDKWAQGQMVICQFGRNREELVNNLKENFPAILKKIREHDKTKIDATVYLGRRNFKLEQEVKDKIGVQIRIPSDFFQAISDGEVIWLRKETTETSSNLMFRKLPYRSQDQLTREGVIAIRDSIGRKYISTRLPNTYMVTNGYDLPVYVSQVQINNQFAVNARGIWEIENDYMGGAFVSYLILNPKTNELIFIDGFLHAPGVDKRNLIQYLDHIINTTKIS